MIIMFKNGQRFDNAAEAARFLGISRTALSQRLEKWQYPFSDIMPEKGTGKRKPCYFRGKRYASRTAAAKAWGISPQAVSEEVGKMRDMA